MEVYFTSPTLGQIYGTVNTEDRKTYYFKGRNVLVCIEVCRSENRWICPKEQWLHDYQINEIGGQIDRQEKWLLSN